MDRMFSGLRQVASSRSASGRAGALRTSFHTVFLALSLALISSSPGQAEQETRSNVIPQITVLSGRADLVSGGDALVELRFGGQVSQSELAVTLNGSNVTGQFAALSDGRYQGLVTGLVEGKNTLVARAGTTGAQLTITNYSKQGPIFSGPQIEPYICETELLGLGPSSPPKCEAPTKYEYFYKRTGFSGLTDPFAPYDLASPPPASEIAMTTTDQGRQVPFIVRRERGVINRAVYDIAVLYQPGQEWKPGSPQAGWNGKVLMVFNGGTKTWHRQALHGFIPNVLTGADWYGRATNNSLAGGEVLSRGFAVATSTMAQVTNSVTATETAMMVKERLIETLGPVRYTIGIGCSGGSMMQHLTANNYPGLIDGLIPMCSLPDMWTVILNQAAFDYPLLGRYFNQLSPQLWPDKKQRAAIFGGVDADTPTPNPVSGDITAQVSMGLVNSWFTTTDSCTANSPAEEPAWVYDPVRNPGGVRCGMQDFHQQIFGTRPKSAWGPIERQLGRGFTNSPVDNVGVQYGLEALQRGQISPEQFVDLNLKVGGLDIDGNWTPERKEAEREGLRNLYRSGQLNDARRLDDVPMVHVHNWFPVDLHHPLVGTEMVRERLKSANGHADNLVRFVTVDDQASGTPGSLRSSPMKRAAFLLVDKWLAAIEADRSEAPRAVKVLRNKPAEARDSCWANGQPGAPCPEIFRFPKMVAGGPVASDIQKCQLKPIAWSDYGSIRFTPDQQRRLRQAFPMGVCDWSKPGVEQQPSPGVWLTFADTVGGRPLAPAPQSHPVAGR